MKNLILSTTFMLVMFFAILPKAEAQIEFSPYAGYSWVNGMVGGEFEIDHWGFSAGYFPTTYPISGDPVSSISGAITYYGSTLNTDSFYLTLGVASAGYRSEVTSSFGYDSKSTAPMSIFTIGYRAYVFKDMYLKLGCGYGYIIDSQDTPGVFTYEGLIGISLGK